MKLQVFDREAIAEWFTTLYSGCSGSIHVSGTNLWTGASFLDVEDAVEWVVGQGSRESLYARATTMPPDGIDVGRGKAHDSFEVVGLWADLDLAGPGHAQPRDGLDLMPDEEAARFVVSGLPEPTAWVHSGGGLYPWWLLHQPYLLSGQIEEAQALSRAWQKFIIRAAARHGWHVDNTSDLAHVLRIPGTYNRKVGLQRPCRVIEASGARYQLDELRAALPAVKAPVVTTSTIAVTAPVDDVRRGPVHAWLSSLPDGALCGVVVEKRDALVAKLGDGRHPAILGPLVAVLRLGVQRHVGVRFAVDECRGAFLEATRPDREAGAAQDEWDKALSGAFRIVRPGQLPTHPACICVIQRLRVLTGRRELFSKGAARNAERSILTYLISRADATGSLRVEESQRQISEATDRQQHTVSMAMSRLQNLGWLHLERARMGAPNRYVLTVPDAGKVVSTKGSAVVENLVDVTLPAHLHPLFRAGGVGASRAEILALLPQFIRRLGKRRTLVAIRDPSVRRPEKPLHRFGPSRRLRAKTVRGKSVEDISRAVGLDRSTVRKHLKRLRQDGLALQWRGKWYRTRFDPGLVSDELGVVDTIAVKRALHQRRRLQYYELMTQEWNGVPPLFLKHEVDGHRMYVDRRTGEVRWRVPESTARRLLA